MRASLICFAVLLSTTVIAGCHHEPGSDKPRGAIMISIFYGGKPVTEGMVNLENPNTGEGGGGELDANGTTTIQNVVLGSYVVTVIPPEPDPVPPEPGQPAPQRKEYPNIPKQFRNPTTSPLKAEVKQENNEFQFELKNKSSEEQVLQ